MAPHTKTWRDYLTDEERAIVEASDQAKSQWEKSAGERAYIMNRAIQRKRYAERKSASARAER